MLEAPFKLGQAQGGGFRPKRLDVSRQVGPPAHVARVSRQSRWVAKAGNTPVKIDARASCQRCEEDLQHVHR